MKILIILAILLMFPTVLGLPLPTPTATPTPDFYEQETTREGSLEGEHVPGKLIVKVKNGVLIYDTKINEFNYKYKVSSIDRLFPGFSSTEKKIDELGKKYSIRAKRAPKDIDISKIKLENIYELTFPEYFPMDKIADEYSSLASVEYAHPRYLRSPEYVPIEPRYSEQWAHQKIQSELAWDIEKGDSDVVVAVDDTGVDYNHNDLKTNIWKNPNEEIGDLNGDGCPGICGKDDDNDGLVDEGDINDDEENGYSDDIRGWDFFSNDNDPMDGNGHGTHVAGIIAAVENRDGVIGICFKCNVMPVRALDEIGIKYAADNGADVVSNSYGGYGYMQSEQDIINYAVALGVIVVASAGNDITDKPHFPSSYKNVISVAATDNNDARASFSNYGDDVDVSAPGVSILSTVPDNEYQRKGGTSMATPYVSGLIGLLLSKNPTLTFEEVEYIIDNEVDYFGVDIPAVDKYIGKGRINALKALEKAASLIELPTYKAEISSPSGGSIFLAQEIRGIANGNTYIVEVGEGYYPSLWKTIGTGTKDQNNYLATFDTTQFRDEQIMTIKLTVEGDKGPVSDTVRVVIDNIFIEEPNRLGYYRHGDIINLKATIRYETSDYILDYSPDIQPRSWSSDGLMYKKEGNVITGKWDSAKLTSIGSYIFRLRSTINGITSTDEKIVAFENYLLGWPKKVEGFIYRSSPMVVDIDHDGTQEIIVGTMTNKVYVFRYDGSYYSGWENGKDIVSEGIRSTIAVGNIDIDPELEIVVNSLASYNSELRDFNPNFYIFNHDGTYVSGWPVKLSSTFSSSPVIFEKNGEKRILIGMYNDGLKMLNTDGTEDTSFVNNVKGSVFSSPVYGNLLKEIPGNEIVVMSCDPCFDMEGLKARTFVYVLHSDGTIAQGWPKEFSGREDESPVLGDVDSDGKIEIIVPLEDQTGFRNVAQIYIFDSAGNILGDPLHRDIMQIDDSSIALADFREDDRLEIAGGRRFDVAVTGFPARLNWFVSISVRTRFSGPVAGDIDGEGSREVIIGGYGKVYAFRLSNPIHQNNRLILIETWPKTVDSWIATTPAIGDLDGDGDVEIVTATDSGSIYVYELTAPYDSSKVDWPMFQHDPWHTGNYHAEFGENAEEFIRGDADGNGKLELSDAIFILNWIFRAGKGPDCWDRADVNDDGKINLSDVVYLLLHLFQGRGAPPAPYPNKGFDPTPDGLPCEN